MKGTRQSVKRDKNAEVACFKNLDLIWDKPLTLSTNSARLILIAPEGSDVYFGMRDKVLEIISKHLLDTELTLCFGGSTTFGHGVRAEETWPAYLSRILPNQTILNCGVVKNDIKANLQLLVALLRLKCNPTRIIFLDGVNEKAGYTKWVRHQEEFVDYDSIYLKLKEYVENYSLLQSRIVLILKLIFGYRGMAFAKIMFSHSQNNSYLGRLRELQKLRNQKNQADSLSFDAVEYVNAAANSYVASKRTIQTIARAFGVQETYFFLQPMSYNASSSKTLPPRFKYMLSLYRKICELDPEVIDISRDCGILMSDNMFFDWQHPDGRGNEIIALEIASKINSKMFKD